MFGHLLSSSIESSEAHFLHGGQKQQWQSLAEESVSTASPGSFATNSGSASPEGFGLATAGGDGLQHGEASLYSGECSGGEDLSVSMPHLLLQNALLQSFVDGSSPLWSESFYSPCQAWTVPGAMGSPPGLYADAEEGLEGDLLGLAGGLPPLPLGSKVAESPSRVSPSYWAHMGSEAPIEDFLELLSSRAASAVTGGRPLQDPLDGQARKVEVERKDEGPKSLTSLVAAAGEQHGRPLKVKVGTEGPNSPHAEALTGQVSDEDAAEVAMWPRSVSEDDLESTFAAHEVTGANENKLAQQAQFAAFSPQTGENQASSAEESKALKSTAETQVVSLANVLPEEHELGSMELPTAGSRLHRLGNCRPCAFLHTKGCTNGKDCSFCHLCSRGEKKRRQREKWQVQQMQQQIYQQQQGFPMASSEMSPSLLGATETMGLYTFSLAAALAAGEV